MWRSRRPPTREVVRPAPTPNRLRQRVGAAGESAAAVVLEQAGLRIVARDWRCRLGQIDLVARDGDTLVIVEVKARRSTSFGLPQEAVDSRKRVKLRALALAYANSVGWADGPLRVDVVALMLDASMTVRSSVHIVDAVGGS